MKHLMKVATGALFAFNKVSVAKSFSINLEKVKTSRDSSHLLKSSSEESSFRVFKNRLEAQEEISVDVTSFDGGHTYMGPLYLGSSKVKAMVNYDTGSRYVTVTSNLCSNCPSKVYSQGSSTTSNDVGTEWELTYPDEDITVKTIEFKDTVCLDEEGTCANDFTFYPITQQWGFAHG